MLRQDAYRQFRFRVVIDGIKQAGFSECSFADGTSDPVEHGEGDDSPVLGKLSGLSKFGNITLKWGIADSLELYNWRQQVIDNGAKRARKNLSIILVDEEGKDKVRWDVVRAWPSKYAPPEFTAKGNEVAIEILKIVHEGFERVS